MSQADVTVGIPAIVNCLIMVPFSIFFHYAYDVGPYVIGRHSPEHGTAPGTSQYHPQHYQGGPLGIRAFAGMMNPGELLGAIGFVFKMGPRKKSSVTPARRGYDTVDSREGRGGGGHDAPAAHEMSRREQRRLDKHGRGANGGYYANASNNGHTNGSYGYNGGQQQNGGYQNGPYR